MKSGSIAIKRIEEFLQEDKIKFGIVDENAVELYMQAKNLTMHLLVYEHNGHIIFRIPGFIRNAELKKPEIYNLMMKIMNEILDIRFEMAPDGRSISACIHHILEDNNITRAQFDLAMMILLHVVDDSYPQFMQALYSTGTVAAADFAPVSPDPRPKDQVEEVEPEPAEEAEEIPLNQRKKSLKIN